jgi:hypothetical protein
MNTVTPVALRAPQAAAYLSLSVQRLASMRLLGRGPPYSKAGHTVLYRLSDLEDWLTANRRHSTSDRALDAA